MPPSKAERLTFSGHETFPFRYTWLKKSVNAVAKDPVALLSEDAMVSLGVGKNMVRSIRYWGLATGVLEEFGKTRVKSLRPSPLGEQLFGKEGWDPFFEDPASMWLIHWKLSSRPNRATTWYWTFNHLQQIEFRKRDLVNHLTALVQEHGLSRVQENTLERDVDCFIRTYLSARPTRTMLVEDTLDCPLVELGLLREIGKGEYAIVRSDHPDLPDELVAYGVAHYWLGRESTASAMSLNELTYAPGSPGRVFCLSEDALLSRLERIARVSSGSMVFDETAGLRQVLVHSAPDPEAALKRYYSGGKGARS